RTEQRRRPATGSIAHMPMIGVGPGQRVDVLQIRDWILEHKPDHALIERAGSMPRQGLSSTFKFGRTAGAVEAAVVLCGIPWALIEPARWKKFHGLRGSDKEHSRQRALQLVPSAHSFLSRKRDHGRAEALLIALAYNGGRV